MRELNITLFIRARYIPKTKKPACGRLICLLKMIEHFLVCFTHTNYFAEFTLGNFYQVHPLRKFATQNYIAVSFNAGQVCNYLPGNTVHFQIYSFSAHAGDGHACFAADPCLFGGLHG